MPKRKVLLILAVVAALAVLLALVIHFQLAAHLQDFMKSALEWIRELGVWGPVLFVLLYILACVLFIPGSVLTLGAGAVFGVVQGSVLVSLGATFGATAAFLVGRYLVRDRVARRIAWNASFTAIDAAVAAEGWKIVVLTRLSPVFPFNLLNYAFGVTRVSLRDYFFASWIGMIPATLMYVYIGSLANTGAGGATTGQWILKGLGLLATIAVTVLITRIARRALSRRLTG
jgi:uncharacterized membrane protein YdjX (TVP38/TMEM64 family)